MNTLNSKLAGFYQKVLAEEAGSGLVDPACLGEMFRDYFGITRTPSVKAACEIISSLGIEISGVDYLDTGGVNMLARGQWHIHYSSRDRAQTQKFDIFHELFEVIYKSLKMINPEIVLPGKQSICRSADRFAAAALIPPDYFIREAVDTGFDLVKLGCALELSHQCLLIAIGEHFNNIPLVGALYELNANGNGHHWQHNQNFTATVVIKTDKARQVRQLCGRQYVPVRNKNPETGSLVCAALKSGQSMLWRKPLIDGFPAIMVRPLYSEKGEIYRAVMIAVPDYKYDIISYQVQSLDPIIVNGDGACPAGSQCGQYSSCMWRIRKEGEYYG
ncbi:MAG: ImmA/IrrE family metallo-endopeptidase [Methanothrix soehngenii]|jgi:hypothetical protein|nr:ImmA/IrrE family metallo-endopeptidase [Methanothrix soehngenii]MDD4488252.1 ImmA/IrrE family metallo-endopeptidase [Methanothrix soehngenii]MDD5499105.1 ImmA/IrrE family metallo-endopeptidase [Dehalococcoidales bacterium]MDX9803936.1 ImmA/IrrE family metallo-endopeptidase [Dehalococcoidales bacterium]